MGYQPFKSSSVRVALPQSLNDIVFSKQEFELLQTLHEAGLDDIVIERWRERKRLLILKDKISRALK